MSDPKKAQPSAVSEAVPATELTDEDLSQVAGGKPPPPPPPKPTTTAQKSADKTDCYIRG